MQNSKDALLKFVTDEKVDVKSIIKGSKYRITILGDRLFRLEYSESRVFYNVPSQVVVNRNFPQADFNKESDNGILTIMTRNFIIKYKEDEPFTKDTLQITSLKGDIDYKYGDTPKPILNRTESSNDIFSKDGYVVIDDSLSANFNERSWLSPKASAVTDIYFLGYGNDFKSGLKDFYHLTGNVPLLPRYAYGNWWGKDRHYREGEIREMVVEFKKRNVPISVLAINDDALAKGEKGNQLHMWSKDDFSNPKKLLDSMRADGIRVSLNLKITDTISPEEKLFKEFANFVGASTSEPIKFSLSNYKHKDGYFSLFVNPLERDGVEFFEIDVDKKVKGEIEPLFAYNHYYFLDNTKTNKRGMLLSQYPGFGGQRYGLVSSGRTYSSFDTLIIQPFMFLSYANAGFGYLSHDIGGFSGGTETGELFARWVQFGVFSPIFRLNSDENTYSVREPWKYNEEISFIASKFMRLRHRLIPYIYNSVRNNSLGGFPMITPLYFYYQGDKKVYDVVDQYMFGTELMVAPVVTPIITMLNKAVRKVYLPNGVWFDFWTGKKLTGGTHEIYTSLRDVPLYAKEGAIIPLAVLTKFNQVDNPKEFDIHIFPGENKEYNLYEDDGYTNAYLKGKSVNTCIKTDFVDDHLKVSVNTTGDISLISNIRVYNFYFRNINPKVNLECMGMISDQYDYSTNTLIVKVMHDVKDELILTAKAKGIVKEEYEYRDEITSLLSQTFYSSELKTKIGYKYNGAHKQIIGLLALPKNEFKQKIEGIDAPKELIAAIKALLV